MLFEISGAEKIILFSSKEVVMLGGITDDTELYQ